MRVISLTGAIKCLQRPCDEAVEAFERTVQILCSHLLYSAFSLISRRL